MKTLGSFILMLLLIFFAPLFCVLAGAFSGWVVSLFFDQSIHAALAAFGVKADNVQLWQIGAMLGFVGSFFRTFSRAYKS